MQHWVYDFGNAGNLKVPFSGFVFCRASVYAGRARNASGIINYQGPLVERKVNRNI